MNAIKENPYLIPNDGKRRVIHFSGGRTSAFMLWHILEAHGGKLPENTLVGFCNTGKEHHKTLLFVHRFQQETGVPIIWVEYAWNPNASGGRKDPKSQFKRVNLRTANLTGRPFKSLLSHQQIVPNQKRRTCTAELKVETVNRYVFRTFGWSSTSFTSVLGMRYDEPKRIKKALWEECRVDYPLYSSKTTEKDVLEFWEQASFDLGIETREGNCDLCFLKGKGKLIRLIRENPNKADWWIEMEDMMLEKKRKGGRLRDISLAQFSKRHTYRQLKLLALSEPELPFDESEDDPSVSCFCGD